MEEDAQFEEIEDLPESNIRGIEEVISAMKSGVAGWNDLMNFSERSFYELNDEFDKIREAIAEAERMGNYEIAQNQVSMANFFVSARDNSVILHALSSLGAQMEKLNTRLEAVEEKLNHIAKSSQER